MYWKVRVIILALLVASGVLVGLAPKATATPSLGVQDGGHHYGEGLPPYTAPQMDPRHTRIQEDSSNQVDIFALVPVVAPILVVAILLVTAAIWLYKRETHYPVN